MRYPTTPIARRGFLGLLAATPLAGALAACSANGATTAGTTLRVGVAAGPSDLNPLDSGSSVTRWIAEPVMETLYSYGPDLTSRPLLAAAEPTVSADRLKWTIPLKQGITFHNGALFTADDVVASLAHVAAFATGSEWVVYFLGYFNASRAVDAHTVEIVLNKPYGLLRSHLTNLPITQRTFAERKDTMMGTGPYRLDKVTPGLKYQLSAYPGYHGTPGAYSGIEFQIIPDGSTRAVNLRAGTIDIATDLPVSSLSLVSADHGVTVHQVDAPIDILAYTSLRSAPFSDADFRHAVAVAMDRQGVNEKVFGGGVTIGQGPIGPAELGYDPALRVYGGAPDIAKAKQLLASSSVRDHSFTLTLSSNQVMQDIAQVLLQSWKQAGITVHLEVLQDAPWAQRWIAGHYQMIMNEFASGFTSGNANYLTLSPAQSHSVLACGYRNPQVDAAMDRIWATTDQKERQALLSQVNAAIAKDGVMLPPVYPKLIVGQRDSVAPLQESELKLCRLGTAAAQPAGASHG